jgi:hypothetical protein
MCTSFSLAQQPTWAQTASLLSFLNRTPLDTHTHPVGLLWTSDKLVTEATRYLHKNDRTENHAHSGIRTPDTCNRAAAVLRLKPYVHPDRPPTVIRVMQLRKMRWRHTACMGKGEVYRGFWWRNLKERNHLEHLHIWEDNIKIDLK